MSHHEAHVANRRYTNEQRATVELLAPQQIAINRQVAGIERHVAGDPVERTTLPIGLPRSIEQNTLRDVTIPIRGRASGAATRRRTQSRVRMASLFISNT